MHSGRWAGKVGVTEENSRETDGMAVDASMRCGVPIAGKCREVWSPFIDVAGNVYRASKGKDIAMSSPVCVDIRNIETAKLFAIAATVRNCYLAQMNRRTAR